MGAAAEALHGAAIAQALTAWMASSARPLAFRRSPDPWAILVAETMAQQTQVARVVRAWAGFLARFPTPAALAAATPADVLRAWAGMGYNRRAINLQRAAAEIVRVHDGQVPSDLAHLQALPGVGPYTARAVAACAFGLPVAPLDTNIRRVLGRMLGGAPTPVELQSTGDTLIAATDPRAWTHALMDVGATVCRPRRPRCEACPLAAWCVSRARLEAAGDAPVRRTRPAPVPFPSTSRWLRGRIVAGLLDRPEGTWEAPPATLGDHDRAAVTAAIDGLVRDGLVERDAGGRSAARGLSAYHRRAMEPLLPLDDPELGRPDLDLDALAERWADRAGLTPMTAEEMRGADARAQRMGVPGEQLMEQAGTAVAATARALIRTAERPADGLLLILCGPGNNGGDGFVAARHLARAGHRSAVVLVSVEPRPETRDAELNWRRLEGIAEVERIHAPTARDVLMLANGIERASIVVDALLGTGVRGALREPIRSAVDLCRRARGAGVPVLAVDAPTALDLSSGEPSDPIVRADATITFHRPKQGLLGRVGRVLAGRVLVAPIGIPVEADPT